MWFGNAKEKRIAGLKSGKITLSDMPEAERDDREVVLAAVNANGENLEHASQRLRDDREVVYAAIRQNGRSLRFASDALRDDDAMAQAAIWKNYLAMAHCSDRLLDSEAFVKDAMHHYSSGVLLCVASERLRANPQMAYSALQKMQIRQNPKEDYVILFQRLSPSMLQSPDFILGCQMSGIDVGFLATCSANVACGLKIKIRPDIVSNPDFVRGCLETGVDVDALAERYGDFALLLMQHLLTMDATPGLEVVNTQHEARILPELAEAKRAAS